MRQYRRTVAVLAVSVCAVAGASAAHAADPPEVQSDRLLEQSLAPNEPGCAAAVARDGRVVWSGGRGLANLATNTPITTRTVFDIGSTSKQFTAASILLLAQRGKLRLSDRLSKHVDDLPKWAGTVTVFQLMHHTSGVPDYIGLLVKAGYTDAKVTTQRQAVRILGKQKKLEFRPGSKWEYSNSNYLLMAEVVARVSDKPLPTFLTANVFRPAGLFMVMDPVAMLPDKATSYLRPAKNAPFQLADSKWEQLGDGAIQTTPIELVKWADNYRTGRIGGSRFLRAQLAGAVKTPEGRYGAGIFVLPDGSLTHAGGWAGFLTAFTISPDRHTAIAVTCNAVDYNYIDNIPAAPPERIPRELRAIWFPAK